MATKATYICIGNSDVIGCTGISLTNAYNTYKEYGGEDPPDECTFYRVGNPLEVQTCIVEVEEIKEL